MLFHLKTYQLWFTLKIFLNNKKIPCILSLLYDDKLFSSFKENMNYCKQFTSQVMTFLKIIENLDPNKTHGHDMISIRTIKICDTSICKPLELIVRSCHEIGKFPTE